MEDRVSSTRSGGRTFAELASSLAEGRARAQQSIEAQRARLRQFEEQITQQLDRISSELSVDRDELENQQAIVCEQAARLEQQQAQLNADQDEWERLQEEATSQQQALAEFLQNQQDGLDKRENSLDAEEAQLRQVQQRLDSSQRDLDDQIEQLSHVRKRVDDKLAALEQERERVDTLAQETKSQRRRITRQLQEQRSEQQRKLQQERQALEQERAELAALRTQLESQAADSGDRSASLHAELEKMTAERDAVQAKLSKVGADFASQKAEHAQAKSTHDEMQAQFEQAQATLDELRESLEQDRCSREQLQAALEQAQAALEQTQADLAASKAELNQLKVELTELSASAKHATSAASTQADATLQKRLEEADQKFDLAADEACELRRRCADLEEKLAKRPAGPSAAEVAQTIHLTEERDALVERLAEAEARAKKASVPADVQQKMQDLQRRFELAVEDVRELKTANADLEKQLRAAKSAARQPDTPAGGNLDWEAQKRKLLAALESEVDEDDEDARRERLSIEGTIQITDEVIAEKQREIDELQQLLEAQSSQMGGMAVGAAAIAATLDQDELIQGERRRLANLQTEWEEKLRRAEIDISVERAKMARERAALEEQLAQANYLQKSASAQANEKPEEKGKKPAGGRWLARLGLKDSGEDKS